MRKIEVVVVKAVWYAALKASSPAFDLMTSAIALSLEEEQQPDTVTLTTPRRLARHSWAGEGVSIRAWSDRQITPFKRSMYR